MPVFILAVSMLARPSVRLSLRVAPLLRLLIILKASFQTISLRFANHSATSPYNTNFTIFCDNFVADIANKRGLYKTPAFTVAFR